MQIHIHHHYHTDSETKKDLKLIKSLLKEIKMNQAELAAELRNVKDQNEKARVEILAKIAALEAAINSAGDVTPEVATALDELKASVQADDDMNADAPTPEA